MTEPTEGTQTPQEEGESPQRAPAVQPPVFGWMVLHEWQEAGDGEGGYVVALFTEGRGGRTAEQRARRFAAKEEADLHYGRGVWKGIPQHVYGYSTERPGCEYWDEADWQVDVKVVPLLAAEVNPPLRRKGGPRG